MFRMQSLLGLGAAAVGALIGVALAAAAATPASLDFETQGLDLDAGAVVESALLAPVPSPESDLRIAYHADRVPHAVLWTEPGAEIAWLPGVAFDAASELAIDAASFSGAPPDVPWTAGATALIRTASGAVFKLGNPVESEAAVRFDYERLR